ncbi:hypothetical protein HYPSUDRAFT_57760 [Hypholoma sublateritium FD-334 SS-4]|uniref:Uncharacterized protein n=1 Tax=Hypholoma sublateritium (strain FD-334 SS-4) TaxID=945553 RepID=A0A0D2M2D0_HYPSF|nr:hypothetical protein HYPSUDRAFT_57760 [Hypholoma sublateritium FD-334 SS-4]
MSHLTPLTLSSKGLSALSQPASDTPSALPSSVHPTRSEPPMKRTAPWKAVALGSYVWVLIEPTRWRVHDEGTEEAEWEALWWPGQFVQGLAIIMALCTPCARTYLLVALDRFRSGVATRREQRHKLLQLCTLLCTLHDITTFPRRYILSESIIDELDFDDEKPAIISQYNAGS